MNNQNRKTIIERLRVRAAQELKTIVLPESHDPRVIEAARTLNRNGLARPLLVRQGNSTPQDLPSIGPDHEEQISRCAQRLFENRQHKGLSFLEAKQSVTQDPLLFASTLVATGQADAAVAGSVATTARVIKAGLYGIGTHPDSKLVSSFFLMQFPESCFTYADCGVVPDPDSEQLANIAIAAAANHEILTGQPARVAMLSFSTKGSATHPRTEKVILATAIAKKIKPDLLIDGELQFDAALLPQVAKRKAPDSQVAGKANVFIFPDLDSGNIAYKISERLGNAVALGPLVQGLKKPFMDLSRGCSPSDIVDVAVVASVLSQNRQRK